MRNGNADVAVLIEPGRVHRDVYTDPEIFELEMERIFGRAWLYVGHASQVREPGDYITTELGRQPVIMVRHRDGAIHVLLNRCTHRGAKVVNERKGNASRLICCYHGWSFDTDGRLASVPVKHDSTPMVTGPVGSLPELEEVLLPHAASTNTAATELATRRQVPSCRRFRIISPSTPKLGRLGRRLVQPRSVVNGWTSRPIGW